MKPSCLFGPVLISAALSAQSSPLFISGLPAGTKSSVGAFQADRAAQRTVVEGYSKLPLAFEANQGQTDARVRFLARGEGYGLFLTSDEAVIVLHQISQPVPTSGRGETLPSQDGKSAVLRMKLVGANTKADVSGQDQLAGKSSYFVGKDPAKWHTNVPRYAKVRYSNLYQGVDLVYYGNQRELEYDFVLRPGADPRKIRLAMEGAKSLQLDEGDLVLGSSAGDIHLRRPRIYQEANGQRQEVRGFFVLKDKNEVGFQVDSYDRRRALTIDPVLAYSSFLSGSSSDVGYGIAVDSAGNAYVTGQTPSADFPIANAIQPAIGGKSDAFVTEVNSDGTALVYSTYLGGSGIDFGVSIVADSAGNAYVTGHTFSTDFPTAAAIQPASGGGSEDAFVTKINASGSALVYSTYLGGSGNDTGDGIAVDSTGNTYITGSTDSTDFPTAAAIQPKNAGGPTDAFVTKINAAGSAFVYSTYLGGSGQEESFGIAVDSSGSAYVTGRTASTDFPTANAIQSNLRSTFGNAFVTKVNAAGSALDYSTYLGGSGGELGAGIAVESAGAAYVIGTTGSSDFPTLNPLQPALGGQNDAFVTKINAAGNALVYSTYLGGSYGETAHGIAADPAGNAYVTGQTDSPNFPVFNPLQTFQLNKLADAYVAAINSSGSAFLYSTFLGGNGWDEGFGVAVDRAGSAYVTGRLNLPVRRFPVTLLAFQQSVHKSATKNRPSAFVTKIALQTSVGVSQHSVSFGNKLVGTSSTPKKVTLTNTGASTLSISRIFVAGANAGDFSETNTCGTSLAPGAHCAISVTFTPSVLGKRKAALGVSDSDAASPQAIALSGTGT